MDMDGARSSSATIPGAMSACSLAAFFPEPRPHVPGALNEAMHFPGARFLTTIGLLVLAASAAGFTRVNPSACAPRQKFVRRVAETPARPRGITPLNVGFASGPHSSSTRGP